MRDIVNPGKRSFPKLLVPAMTHGPTHPSADRGRHDPDWAGKLDLTGRVLCNDVTALALSVVE